MKPRDYTTLSLFIKNGITNLRLYGVARWLKRLSPSTRADVLMQMIRLSVQDASPKNTLLFLFELENQLYQLEGKAAVDYGKGIHTKHRHTRYHHFFINNLKPGERVLDIGCGNGFLSYDMAAQVPEVTVVGIDLNEDNVRYAREHYKHPNLNFIHGDALKELPDGTFDVVTLSNVLEHIELRIEFLKKIVQQIKPKRLIIRVPVFERDWRVPLKKELGMDYRLDSTHCIEYTQEEYFEELLQAGLKATLVEFRWAEIWSVVEPLHGEETDRTMDILRGYDTDIKSLK
ncbi:MAG: class I SAM-dependent methyltransferase [Methanophagales archaeon]|nr:class I SAM-dependent methyltransferase [Methanophagales archaeon]